MDVARLSSTASRASSWPHAAILTGAVVAPERLPTASTAVTTCTVAALTRPKTTCLLSSRGAATVVIRNWLPEMMRSQALGIGYMHA